MDNYEIDIKLNNLIVEAYTLFSKYKLGSTLTVCSCCVFEEEVQTLVHTPLSMVSREILQSAYYESAHGDSDQELIEMKHFLPRVLELILKHEYPCHSEEIVFSRIDLTQTERWKKEELELLKAFSLLYFKKVLKFEYPYAEDVLIMFGYGGFDLTPLLDEWKNGDNEKDLFHLYNLLSTGVKYKGGELFEMGNAFSTPEINNNIFNWLKDKTVVQKFSTKIEKMLLDETIELDDETWLELDVIYGFLNG